MGSYATTTSISNLIPNYLVGNTTTSDTAGTNIFSAHIERAEAVVNAAVTAQYSLPFSTVPPLLRTLSEDIACYFVVRGSYTQDGQNKNEYYPEYKEALKILDLLREGKIKLTLTDGSLLPTASNNRYLSSTENYTPVFGLDAADQWKRDSDEIEDQAAARE